MYGMRDTSDEFYFTEELESNFTHSTLDSAISSEVSDFQNGGKIETFQEESYCTPKSLLTLESMGLSSDVLRNQLNSQSNIWSITYRNGNEKSLSLCGGARKITNPDSETIKRYGRQRSSLGRELDIPRPLFIYDYKNNKVRVPDGSKFFVIKSYSTSDVCASFVNNIWASTDLGNKRLSKAYSELDENGKIFLFFSVNASGKFCGVAEMVGNVDFTKTSNIWSEKSRWKGIFSVQWILVKDISNRYLQHLRVPSNENKSVTNSRDTQEIPFDVGVSMIKLVNSFRSKTNILQN